MTHLKEIDCSLLFLKYQIICSLAGMMLDWIYNHTNCLTIAVELDCKKYPDIEDISSLWLENRLPLLIFMSQVYS